MDKQIQLETLKLELETLKLEQEKQRTKQCELKISPKVSGSNSAIGSKPPSGSNSPGGGKVQSLRRSISSNYISSVSTPPDTAPVPDAQSYLAKLKYLVARNNKDTKSSISLSTNGGNLVFSNGPQVIGSVPVVEGEKEADIFYKKLYYYFFYECGLDPKSLCDCMKDSCFLDSYLLNEKSPTVSGIQSK